MSFVQLTILIVAAFLNITTDSNKAEKKRICFLEKEVPDGRQGGPFLLLRIRLRNYDY